MRELPALFRTEMARAIFDDRKWKTRRLFGLEDVNKNPDLWTLHKIGILDYMVKKSSQGKFGAYFHSEQIELNTLSVCPQVSKWQKGDHLWVRETHSIKSIGGARTDFVYYKATPGCGRWLNRSNEWVEEKPLNKFHTLPNKWSSPLFMPKWAARLWLEVLDVRVERLQDISEEDAIAEGIQTVSLAQIPRQAVWSERQDFSQYWDTIYKKKPEFQWQANPWVWVYEFKKIGQSQP